MPVESAIRQRVGKRTSGEVSARKDHAVEKHLRDYFVHAFSFEDICLSGRNSRDAQRSVMALGRLHPRHDVSAGTFLRDVRRAVKLQREKFPVRVVTVGLRAVVLEDISATIRVLQTLAVLDQRQTSTLRVSLAMMMGITPRLGRDWVCLVSTAGQPWKF